MTAAFSLRTARLVLDLPGESDIPRIVDYCADPLFKDMLTLPWPYAVTDARFFLSEIVERGWRTGTELTWALREGPGEPLLGVIGVRMPSRREADLGFWLGAPHRGKGYMPEAVRAVTDHLFNSERVNAVGWSCRVGNVASAAVARKAGFTFTRFAPSGITYRDGSHPLSLFGVLAAGDPPVPRPGWPEGAVPDPLPLPRVPQMPPSPGPHEIEGERRR